MAGYHVPPLERLVDKFESLPGVGHKSAQRIAYAVLNMDKADAESFAQAIIDAHEPDPLLLRVLQFDGRRPLPRVPR